jgi:3-(3-hydroxy-phenyl)propionate hydroxylase
MKARLQAHGVEVLGMTDHHIFKSIYFFDPNGVRLELSAQVANEFQMLQESKTAHARLNEWTARKEQWRADRADGKAAEPLKPQQNDRPEYVKAEPLKRSAMPRPSFSSHPVQQRLRIHPGQRVCAARIPVCRAPGNRGSGHAPGHTVVIVGGGITGLTLACALARNGVAAVLLDEDNTVGVKGRPRAASATPRNRSRSFTGWASTSALRPRASSGAWAAPLPARTRSTPSTCASRRLQPVDPAALHQHPAVLHRGLSGERIQELGHVDMRWNNRVTAFTQDADGATLTVTTPAGDYQLRGRPCDRRHRLAHPVSPVVQAGDGQKGRRPLVHCRRALHQAPPTERHTWIEAPFNENRAVWQHLMATTSGALTTRWRPMPTLTLSAAKTRCVSAWPASSGRTCGVRHRLGGPLCLPQRVHGPDAPRPRVLHGRLGQDGEPVWRARRQHRHCRCRQPGLEAGCGAARPAPPALLDSYHEERHEAAHQNVQVTNRTARFPAPGDGIERLFRSAAIGLAKQHPFARQLSTPGAWPWPTPTRSPACATPPAGCRCRTWAFAWADGSTGTVNDLLQWAGGHCCCWCLAT